MAYPIYKVLSWIGSALAPAFAQIALAVRRRTQLQPILDRVRALAQRPDAEKRLAELQLRIVEAERAIAALAEKLEAAESGSIHRGAQVIRDEIGKDVLRARLASYLTSLLAPASKRQLESAAVSAWTYLRRLEEPMPSENYVRQVLILGQTQEDRVSRRLLEVFAHEVLGERAAHLSAEVAQSFSGLPGLAESKRDSESDLAN